MSNRDESIENALIDVENGQFCSIRQSAAYHRVPLLTLAHHYRGRQVQSSIDLSSQRITKLKERVLVAWIQDLQKQHMSPNYHQIQFLIEQLLIKKGDKNPLGSQ